MHLKSLSSNHCIGLFMNKYVFISCGVLDDLISETAVMSVPKFSL